MTDDIVERLRAHDTNGDIHCEAAAEIEALREHVNALRLVATSHEPEALRLQAEIERLRAEISRWQTAYEEYQARFARALEPKP